MYLKRNVNNASSVLIVYNTANTLMQRMEPAYMKWSILGQEPIKRAAAGASVQPEHHRVVDRVPLGSHKPARDQNQNQVHGEFKQTPGAKRRT